MKEFVWSEEKNEMLRRERGVCFEDVLVHIAEGGLLDVVEHGNRARYPGQRIFIVDIEGYAYLVPFVESEREIFLKTIIPSRKVTRDYLGRRQ